MRTAIFLCTLFAGFLTLSSCVDSISKIDSSGIDTTTTPTGDTTLSAVSSASKKIKVVSGTIYSDNVSFTFWYQYANGFTWAKVIDDQGNQILFDTLSLDESGPPARTNASHCMKPLQPATHYRLIIDGNFDGGTDGNPNVHTNVNDGVHWSLDTIPFTTRSLP